MDLNPNRTIPFGKHEFETVREVLENDPWYIVWLAINVPDFPITDQEDDEAAEAAQVDDDWMIPYDPFWD